MLMLSRNRARGLGFATELTKVDAARALVNDNNERLGDHVIVEYIIANNNQFRPRREWDIDAVIDYLKNTVKASPAAMFKVYVYKYTILLLKNYNKYNNNDDLVKEKLKKYVRDAKNRPLTKKQNDFIDDLNYGSLTDLAKFYAKLFLDVDGRTANKIIYSYFITGA